MNFQQKEWIYNELFGAGKLDLKKNEHHDWLQDLADQWISNQSRMKIWLEYEWDQI